MAGILLKAGTAYLSQAYGFTSRFFCGVHVTYLSSFLCCVFVFSFVFVLCLAWPKLLLSSVFSKVYLLEIGFIYVCLKTKNKYLVVYNVYCNIGTLKTQQVI